MDPFATAAKLLSKLLRMGLSADTAGRPTGIDPSALMDLRAWLDLTGEFDGTDTPHDASALQLALITRSFGQALRRQGEAVDARGSPFSKQEIEKRLADVVQVLSPSGTLPADWQALRRVDSLTGNPLETRYYRALWKAFGVARSEEAPASARRELEEGDGLRFERHFLLAYDQNLTASVDPSLERYRQVLRSIYRLRVKDGA